MPRGSRASSARGGRAPSAPPRPVPRWRRRHDILPTTPWPVGPLTLRPLRVPVTNHEFGAAKRTNHLRNLHRIRDMSGAGSRFGEAPDAGPRGRSLAPDLTFDVTLCMWITLRPVCTENGLRGFFRTHPVDGITAGSDRMNA